jgi:glycosyltransferase involved in cell wall biosynthesis
MSSCIYYHPEAYSISGPKLMGRNAAGESFLRGFLQHSSRNQGLWVQASEKQHFDHFALQAANYDRNENITTISNANLGLLETAGTVYFPGPGLAEHAFKRSLYGDSLWSLCGITHTTSSASAMDAITDLITAPVQPWDALICTSSAVKKNVEIVLQAHADYLAARLGISRLVLPKLPVIPLGVHTDDFKYSDNQREASRKRLGVDSDTLVVLYVGRLSFHAKAHPLGMYKALEIAAKKTGKNVVLVECGWHANEPIKQAFADAAEYACPTVRVVTLDGRDSTNREIAWSGADVFCSLSDNIQETFGIVPLEAMAAGLPVVVSDWDGYKDTVRNGIDGFRIRTITPPSGLGGDLAHRHALGIDTYDMYCGYSSSVVSVDINATAKAFEQLFLSTELRKKMGNAGRARARELYDWKKIIKTYEDLWAELGEVRLGAKNSADTSKSVWGARLDPTTAFANYPTSHLAPETKLRLVAQNTKEARSQLDDLKRLMMVNYANYVFPRDHEIDMVLKNAKKEFQSTDTLLSGIEQSRRANVYRGLVWLLKIGVLEAL